jgi:hypothetical protein
MITCDNVSLNGVIRHSLWNVNLPTISIAMGWWVIYRGVHPLKEVLPLGIL